MTILPFRPRFLPRKTYGSDFLRWIAIGLNGLLFVGFAAVWLGLLALCMPWLKVVG